MTSPIVFHRAKVYRRRPRSPFESVSMSLMGDTWSWPCDCDAIEHPVPAQWIGYIRACNHVTDRHR